MKIESRYSVGDTVYEATTTRKEKNVVCPDCLGRKWWKVIFPNRKSIKTKCQTCGIGFGEPTGKIKNYDFFPEYRAVKIKEVRYDSTNECPFSYLVDRGNSDSHTYMEQKELFKTKKGALSFAKRELISRQKEELKNRLEKSPEKIGQMLSLLGYSRSEKIEKLNEMISWAESSGIEEDARDKILNTDNIKLEYYYEK